jgi:REP element-mobilizing transposase RayT
MSRFQNKYRIESSRLRGWDYSSPGTYFITVCTFKRIHLFGEITQNKMELNRFGEIVALEWEKSVEIRQELITDEFIIMPNHFHGIVQLIDLPPVETPGRASLQWDRTSFPRGRV